MMVCIDQALENGADLSSKEFVSGGLRYSEFRVSGWVNGLEIAGGCIAESKKRVFVELSVISSRRDGLNTDEITFKIKNDKDDFDLDFSDWILWQHDFT